MIVSSSSRGFSDKKDACAKSWARLCANTARRRPALGPTLRKPWLNPIGS